MHTLSKLIICLVMLRGRHRGLPVAIDRAVMLPSEFTKEDDEHLDSRSHHSYTRNDTLEHRPISHSESLNPHGPQPSKIRQRLQRFSTKFSNEYTPAAPPTDPGYVSRNNHDLNEIEEDRSSSSRSY